MIFYGVVSLGGVVGFFPTYRQACRMIEEVRGDEPELTDTLTIRARRVRAEPELSARP